MQQIEFKNEKFSVLGWPELTGSQFEEITEFLEQGADPNVMTESIQRCLGIFVPAAVEIMQGWIVLEVWLFWTAVLPRIGFDECSRVMKRYVVAGDRIAAYVKSECAKARKSIN